MTKHTSAPWRVVDYSSENKGFIAVVAGDKEHICDVFPFGARDGGIKREIEQHQANARLISAAPDLAAFAESILIYQTEGDEERLQVSIGAGPALIWPAGGPEARFFLAMEAARRAAISKIEEQ